jgi:predicted amidohydrolase
MSDRCLAVAAVQMVSGAVPDVNLLALEQRMAELTGQGPLDLLVLPENVLCFDAAHYAGFAAQYRHWLDCLQSLARRYRVALVAGSMPVPVRPDGTPTDGRYRSACFAISAEGELRARYDKIHLFDAEVGDTQGQYRESDSFEPGDSAVVVDLAGLRVGLSICYDLRFPALYQRLREDGADLIVVPAAFTEVTGTAHWEVLLRARAIETQCYLIAADQGGQHNPQRRTWGHSMIVSPWGEVLASLAQGPGAVRAEIDLARQREIRRRLPVFEHRRPIRRDI